MIKGIHSSPPTVWEKLKPLAREMRHKPTQAEDLLWQRLRNRQVSHAKFRRQHAIDRFLVDFYCAEASLIIEVDGEIHQNTPEEDAIRQEFLESQGLKVMRFPNEAVMEQMEEVIQKIEQYLTPNPSPLAERGMR